MRTCGLTLGKYAPFHRGHQLVIETALREVDSLVVMIYDTDLMDVPLNVRAGWIRKLYPQVTVIECWDGPKGDASDPDYEKREEDYILRMLAGREISHFFCSEHYGAHVSAALHAIDRRVDAERSMVPVSGTAIRKAPFALRAFVDPVVYADLIAKIVFVGAMSTGKSTLVSALAERHGTAFAPEYGREYWAKNQVDRRIGLEEFDLIVDGHIAGEDDAIANARNYLFVDTNAVTTYMFCMGYHGRVTPHLEQTAARNASRYDLWFLCEDDIPYDDTWDRSGPQKRSVFHRQIIADLKERRIPYIPLRGSLEERMAKVDHVLAGFRKYANFHGENGSEQGT